MRQAAELAQEPGFAPLIERYRQSLKDYVSEIASASATGDSEKLEQITHRLAGTAMNYGFPNITLKARSCNEALRMAVPPSDLKKMISSLREEMERESENGPV